MTGPENPAAGRIEVRLNAVAQLFHTLDPSPFREGDLNEAAADYMLAQARRLPAGDPLEIVVHLPPAEVASPVAPMIGPAISGYFARMARAEEDTLRELFRAGRRALAIGAGVLSLSLLVTFWMSSVGLDGPISRIVQESIKILGWVSLWRPAEVFFYDWVPIARRRDLDRRLSQATITITPDGVPA